MTSPFQSTPTQSDVGLINDAVQIFRKEMKSLLSYKDAWDDKKIVQDCKKTAAIILAPGSSLHDNLQSSENYFGLHELIWKNFKEIVQEEEVKVKQRRKQVEGKLEELQDRLCHAYKTLVEGDIPAGLLQSQKKLNLEMFSESCSAVPAAVREEKIGDFERRLDNLQKKNGSGVGSADVQESDGYHSLVGESSEGNEEDVGGLDEADGMVSGFASGNGQLAEVKVDLPSPSPSTEEILGDTSEGSNETKSIEGNGYDGDVIRNESLLTVKDTHHSPLSISASQRELSGYEHVSAEDQDGVEVFVGGRGEPRNDDMENLERGSASGTDHDDDDGLKQFADTPSTSLGEASSDTSTSEDTNEPPRLSVPASNKNVTTVEINGKPHYLCIHCQQTFISRSSTYCHLHCEKPYAEWPHVCKTCGERFKCPNKFRKHCKNTLKCDRADSRPPKLVAEVDIAASENVSNEVEVSNGNDMGNVVIEVDGNALSGATTASSSRSFRPDRKRSYVYDDDDDDEEEDDVSNVNVEPPRKTNKTVKTKGSSTPLVIPGDNENVVVMKDSDGYWYLCMVCKTKFITPSRTYNHLSCGKQKEEWRYKCDRCNQKFRNHDALYDHRKGRNGSGPKCPKLK